MNLKIVSLADYNFTLYGDQPEFFMYKFPERATTYKVNSGGWALYTEPNFQGKVMYHLGSKFFIINLEVVDIYYYSLFVIFMAEA